MRVINASDFTIGDKVVMKKKHPCGENSWTIIRYGADVKIRCNNCERTVMIPRYKFVNNVRNIIAKKEK